MTERGLLTGDEYTRSKEKDFNIYIVTSQNKIYKEKSNHYQLKKIKFISFFFKEYIKNIIVHKKRQGYVQKVLHPIHQ